MKSRYSMEDKAALEWGEEDGFGTIVAWFPKNDPRARETGWKRAQSVGMQRMMIGLCSGSVHLLYPACFRLGRP